MIVLDRRLCASLVLVALSLGPLAGSARADEFAEKKKTYRAYLKRDSLFMRTRGRNRFAATRDTRALTLLAKAYGKPEVPKDQVRYLIATICARHLKQAATVPIWDAWREKFTQSRDGWLWYRGLEIKLQHAGAEGLLAIARGSEDAFLRMAAVEALADKRDAGLIALVGALAADLPRADPERAVVMESLVEALEALSAELASAPFKEAAAALVTRMDDKETSDRTRLVMARSLARLLGTDILGLNAEPWLRQLKVGRGGGTQDGRYAPGKPTFAGIQATGMRIAYLIDTSDSMLTPLTGKELEDLRRPTTGGHGASKGDGLPWHKIKTRFDAAREFLKLSLENLAADQSYNVILFGTEALRLKPKSGLMAATQGNIKRTCKALDAIVAGPANRRRPNGTLHGNTNIHGAMHRAFKLKAKGMVRSEEYVDAACFSQGCDTIFLLSDGAPTWDDFGSRDTRDPEDRGGDPEMGKGGMKPQFLNYYGPYALPLYLVDDIRRLNLFRKVEIHCIGMGEARMPLLKRIAALGHGQAKKIGVQPKPEEKAPEKGK